jgi:predicted outer membrane repeat protein
MDNDLNQPQSSTYGQQPPPLDQRPSSQDEQPQQPLLDESPPQWGQQPLPQDRQPPYGPPQYGGSPILTSWPPQPPKKRSSRWPRIILALLAGLIALSCIGSVIFVALSIRLAGSVTNLNDNGLGSLRWAIALAPAGSTITFDAKLHGTILLTSGDLSIMKNLTLRGPGGGVLSISSGKSGHIIHVRYGASVTISGLTFKDSKTLTSFIDNEGTLTLSNSTVSANTAVDGGGISNEGTGSLTLSSSTVSGNTATGDGGGILNEGTGSLTLSISTVSGNTATGDGGGILNEGTGSLTLSNSTVSGNTGSGILNEGAGSLTLSNSTVSGNTGGGIYSGGTLTLSNSTVSGNTAVEGGGIYSGGTLTLSNSTVSGNTASGPNSEGGGIFGVGTLTLNDSTVSDNRASSGGGIYSSDNSTLTLNDSTVSGNRASSGGGIYNDTGEVGGTLSASNGTEGALTLNDSTVSGNRATGNGGGIYNDVGGTLTLSNSTVGTLTLSNSTVSGNRATGNGGGIAISIREISGSGTLPAQVILLYCTVYGNTANVGGGIWIGKMIIHWIGNLQQAMAMGASIVAGNSAHAGPDVAGQLASSGYNLVGDRSGATFLGSPKMQPTDVLGMPSSDLKIDPLLRDNGGSARPHTWTHALLPESPAIDLTPPEACRMFKVFDDQRGVKRPQGKGCDSGAYEYVPSQ